MQHNPLSKPYTIGRQRFKKEPPSAQLQAHSLTDIELAIQERVRKSLHQDIQRHAKTIRLLNEEIETHSLIFDRTKLQSVCCHVQPTPWYDVGRTPGCTRSQIYMKCDLCQINMRVCIVRDRNNQSPVYAKHGYLYNGHTFFSKDELLEAGCLLELEGLSQLLHNLGACIDE